MMIFVWESPFGLFFLAFVYWEEGGDPDFRQDDNVGAAGGQRGRRSVHY